MPERVDITVDCVPKLARHVKLRFDKARNCWVLLAPERVLMPDDTALEVLQSLDGNATVQAIAERLAADYDAPAATIAQDIQAMLQDMADKGFVTA